MGNGAGLQCAGHLSIAAQKSRQFQNITAWKKKKKRNITACIPEDKFLSGTMLFCSQHISVTSSLTAIRDTVFVGNEFSVLFQETKNPVYNRYGL